MTLQIPTPGNTITKQIRRAHHERDVVSLLKAGYCIVRQGRFTELLYGFYCSAATRASAVQPRGLDRIMAALPGLEPLLTESADVVNRDQLIDAFNDRYAVSGLPADFAGCRAQAIARVGARLVLGEYGQNAARVAVVSRDRCEVFDPYALTRGVRHIHLVYPTGVTDEVFMTTGDASKVLDRFTIAYGDPRLLVRHRTRLAGYTAVAEAGGSFFFGTDFSSRPNYIETLQGDMYFFPAGAYRRWVQSLTTLWQRYLVAVSEDQDETRVVSVFDVHERAFVLCMPWAELFRPPSG